VNGRSDNEMVNRLGLPNFSPSISELVFCDLFPRLLKGKFEHNTVNAVFFDERFFICHPIHQLLFEVITSEQPL